jgi:uncharacterized membrane protein YeaQ/YmgE (transglycosylase-associated protein family)
LDVLVVILSVLVVGLLIGWLARLAVPGPDPMPIWLTVAIGLVGTVVGGLIGIAVFGKEVGYHSFLVVGFEIWSGAFVIACYRKLVQKRPLTGPGAKVRPTRGIGLRRR